MINSIVYAIFKVIFVVLRLIGDLVLLPLTLVTRFFPTFNEFMNDALSFFDTYVIKSIGFAKQVFINMTGFPQEIITISVEASLLIIGMIGVFKLVAFVKNLWRLLKGGE